MFSEKGELLAGSKTSPRLKNIPQKHLPHLRNGTFVAYQDETEIPLGLYFFSPVRDGSSGGTKAIICGRINTGQIAQLVKRYMHQNTGEIFILEKDAKTILFSNLDHYPRDLFANIIPPEKRQGALRYKSALEKKVGGFMTEKGYLQYPGLEWKVAVNKPEEELSTGIRLFLYRLTLLSILVSAAIAALVCICAKLITDNLFRPIKQLERHAQHISENGDLSTLFESKAKDEIGTLAQAFNGMTANMSDIIKEVNNTAKKINEAAQRLSASTQEVSASTQEISTTMHEINTGAVDQSSKTSATITTINEMIDSVSSVNLNAKLGAEAAQETARLAAQGVDNSAKAVAKIIRINEVATDVKTLVMNLGDRSVRIGKILAVITNIADQTNLLSLNAAIEAARAGEAGRGFSVVAEEIRKLAENSGQAASQINKLLKEIQAETGQAITSVQLANEEVEEGSYIIDNVRVALDSILQAAKQSERQVQQMYEAAQIQLKKVNLVNTAVKGIDTVAKSSEGSTRDVTQALAEMSGNTQNVTATAQSLVEMAAKLQQTVRKFKL